MNTLKKLEKEAVGELSEIMPRGFTIHWERDYTDHIVDRLESLLLQQIRRAYEAGKKDLEQDIADRAPQHCFGCKGKCTGLHYRDIINSLSSKH